MGRIGLIAAGLAAAAGARADLVTHALVRYGDVSLTVDEHFGAGAAAAQLIYSTPGSFHGAAEGTAGYGSVSATATVLGVSTAYPVNAAQAEGGFSDVLTISGPAGAGFVVYTYTVAGWATGDLSVGSLFLRHGSDPDEEISDEIVGPGVFASLPHSLLFGQPFATGIVLRADAGMGLGGTGEFGCDLSATLTGLEVFDAAMNPIGQFAVGSASGTQYPVPGPGALGALLMAGVRRRRAVWWGRA